MADAASDDLADVRAVIQALRDHAEELRRKGLPVDDMIRDLERKIEAYRIARQKASDLQAQDEEFERERSERRRELDAAVASLPQTSRTECRRPSTWPGSRREKPGDGGAAGRAWASRERPGARVRHHGREQAAEARIPGRQEGHPAAL